MNEPSYLQMVKQDLATIQAEARAISDGDGVEAALRIIGKAIKHAEQCLDCAVAALDESHRKTVGGYKI